MRSIEEKLEYLRDMPERNTLEFYQLLRHILQISYKKNLNYLSHIIEEFLGDILAHGVFYTDVINNNLKYFLRKDKKMTLLQLNLFLLTVEKILPICDKDSLEILEIFYRKIIKVDIQMSYQIKEFIKYTQDNLNVTAHKIQQYSLHPYKNIIIHWY